MVANVLTMGSVGLGQFVQIRRIGVVALDYSDFSAKNLLGEREN
jgi:hypothetical protein